MCVGSLTTIFKDPKGPLIREWDGKTSFRLTSPRGGSQGLVFNGDTVEELR